MGRPKTLKPKAGESFHLTVAIDGALVKALDEEAKRMTDLGAGLKFTRTDALRVVLHRWMTSLEQETK